MTDGVTRWARCAPLMVAIWAGTTLAQVGLAEESARPSGAACTPTKLVIVVTSLDTNAVVIVGLPLALRVHVADDCGESLTQGGSVEVSFAPPLPLTSLGLGDWGTTFSPPQTGQLSASIMAHDPAGVLKGTATLSVTVNGLPRVQISVLRVHDPNAFAVPGGEPIAIDVSLTSDGVPVEFFVSKVMFNLKSGQYTVNPARATTPATVQILVSVPLSQDSRVLYQIYPQVDWSSGSVTAGVTLPLRPPPPPALLVDTSPVLFSTTGAADRQNRQYFVRNASGIPLTFTAEASGGNWLKPVLQAYPFDADSEPLASAPTYDCSSCPITFRAPGILSIAVDPAGLPSGTYSGSITLSDDAGGSPQLIPVTMIVGAGLPSILVSQTGLTFTAVEGGFTEPAQSFSVLNSGSGVMDWTATVNEGADWLQIERAAGQSSAGASQNPEIIVTADAKGLQAGQYYAQIEVSAPQANNAIQIVSAVLNVLPQGSEPIPIVRPTGLVFTGVTEGEVPPSQTILISNISDQGTGFSPVRVFSNTYDGPQWLLADLTSSTGTYIQQPAPLIAGTPVNLVVRAIPKPVTGEPLSPGVRRGIITVAFQDGSHREVEVLYVLNPPAASKPVPPAASRSADSCATELRPWITSLANQFQTTAGWPAPIEVRVVDDCSQALTSGSVVASFSGGEDPIALTHVQNGNWTGTWVPRNKAAAQQISILARDTSRSISGESQKVQGTVTTDADTPVMDAKTITDEVSKIRRTFLAPGSRFSVYGDRLLDNCVDGSPPQVGDLELIIIKRTLLLLRAPSCGRIDAVLPYDLPVDTPGLQLFMYRNGITSAGIPVTIAFAEPSIFTADDSGQGMARAYRVDDTGNALTVPIDATQPAIAGGLLVIECAGLGVVGGDASVKNPVKVKIGDANVDAQSATLIDSAAGIYRVTVLVPPDTPLSDAVPLVVSVGDDKASSEVTIPVGLP